MSIALLFPGQGAQRPGMLALVPETSAAQETLTQARHVCQRLDSHVDLDDPGRDTVATQLSLVSVGVACSRALTVDGQLPVAFAAGHSVGAFTAAVAAGVLTLPDALATVYLRANAMRAACADRRWGMAAINGVTLSAAHSLASGVSTPDQPLWVANVNSATQIVVAGTLAALDRAESDARRRGARSFERLDVEVASHGPIQTSTEAALREQLASVTTRPPTLSYITNSGGRAARTAQAVVDDLAASVSRTVQWYDGVRLMYELGVTCAVEVVPGHTLSRLVASAVPAVSTMAVDEQSLPAVIAQARR